MHPSEITACIVTRGDVDLTEILASLHEFDEVIVYDNSQREHDLSVYGRYAAIAEAKHEVVYVQDDDCLVDAERVCRSYMPHTLIANMPAGRWPDYPDSALVGWGAVFDRRLPEQAFARMQRESVVLRHEGEALIGEYSAAPASFYRTCDVVFSTVIPHIKIDVGFQHLPWAEGPGRMFTTDYAAHKAERDKMLDLARRVRDST